MTAHSEAPRMLQVGDPAPAFSLASDGGRTVDSAGLAGRRYVLFFYPKDATPGCTREVCAFRDDMPGFINLGVAVFGVSADRVPAHDRFVKKHGLNVPLLSDPDHGLLQAYGVWVEKSLYGRKYMGIHRSSFVVGPDGMIEMAWDKVKPDTHAAEVLDWLAEHAPAAKKTARRR
jgi:peroxiredoxin Q/BCP